LNFFLCASFFHGASPPPGQRFDFFFSGFCPPFPVRCPEKVRRIVRAASVHLFGASYRFFFFFSFFPFRFFFWLCSLPVLHFFSGRQTSPRAVLHVPLGSQSPVVFGCAFPRSPKVFERFLALWPKGVLAWLPPAYFFSRSWLKTIGSSVPF